jgi:hypothetical protein
MPCLGPITARSRVLEKKVKQKEEIRLGMILRICTTILEQLNIHS